MDTKTAKQNRAMGADTEKRTRQDLESKDWIVLKCNNNVDLVKEKFITAKNFFIGKGRPMMLGQGFPDFFAYKCKGKYYEVVGVECKSNGYLDKIEKEKCEWLLKNKIFGKILIASREKINNKITIKYKKFEVKNGEK